MKKVAGTLKLDQAQYRELEAFSKFGSDLDATTKAVLDKGSRNVEMLKQPQFSPIPVERQIAMIYLGTKGLLAGVPVNRVKEFEKEYLDILDMKNKETLEELRKGVINDQVTGVLESTAKDIIARYK